MKRCCAPLTRRWGASEGGRTDPSGRGHAVSMPLLRGLGGVQRSGEQRPVAVDDGLAGGDADGDARPGDPQSRERGVRAVPRAAGEPGAAMRGKPGVLNGPERLRREMKRAERERLENALLFQLRAARAPTPVRQYVFAPGRD